MDFTHFIRHILPVLEYSYTAFKPTKSQEDKIETRQKPFTKHICDKLGLNSTLISHASLMRFDLVYFQLKFPLKLTDVF